MQNMKVLVITLPVTYKPDATRNPDSSVNNEEANKKNKRWAETAASKRVKQKSQNTLTNNKMSIPSKSPEDEVLTC